ncbi:MAG TPA: ATP-binding cassette domain-containing protein, partial [Thermodesulfobacteriota bacterium]|nr:ATP-binding cassette domain-containing protein [Thermodesulfobacteriota bacterium]
MGENNALLIGRRLNKKFGGVQAIRDLTVAIQKGKITGLIGPNGAGKTTFFNLINGIYPLDAGEILLGGKKINGLSPDAIAAAGISRTFQLLNNFPRLSVYENIRAGVITKFLDRRKEEEKITDMLELLRISHLADTDISEIPPVARKLVEVGRALIADPQLVL